MAKMKMILTKKNYINIRKELSMMVLQKELFLKHQMKLFMY